MPPEARWQRRVVVRPQDYSGFGLKPQKPTPKSAQLASRAPVRAAWAQEGYPSTNARCPSTRRCSATSIRTQIACVRRCSTLAVASNAAGAGSGMSALGSMMLSVAGRLRLASASVQDRASVLGETEPASQRVA